MCEWRHKNILFIIQAPCDLRIYPQNYIRKQFERIHEALPFVINVSAYSSLVAIRPNRFNSCPPPAIHFR